MDDDGFKKKRQNVIGISLILILLKFFEVKPPSELNIFNVIIPIKEPAYFHVALWLLFFYFLYRLYIEWIDSEVKPYNVYMRTKIWLPLSIGVANSFVKNNRIYPDELDRFKNELFTFLHKRNIDNLFIPFTFNFSEFRVITSLFGITLQIDRIKFQYPFHWCVFFPFLKHQIIGSLKSKYLTETILPITLAVCTLTYVGIPELWCFILSLITI